MRTIFHYERERAMSKVMTKGCACDQLDDDLMAEGWTCYACYEADNE
jgi:hypothetical protein